MYTEKQIWETSEVFNSRCELLSRFFDDKIKRSLPLHFGLKILSLQDVSYVWPVRSFRCVNFRQERRSRLMDMDIELWCSNLTVRLQSTFGSELVFVGLQGSYGRKEATPSSDIDVVVILDEINTEKLEKYRSVIDSMPYHERACGFIAGLRDIASWIPGEIFLLVNDTLPIYGSLDFLCGKYTKKDIADFIKSSACAIYHGCCHNFLFERDSALLLSLYKAAFFLLRTKYYHDNGTFIKRERDLTALLSGSDAEILNTKAKLSEVKQTAGTDNFTEASERLISWCSDIIRFYK